MSSTVEGPEWIYALVGAQRPLNSSNTMTKVDFIVLFQQLGRGG